MPMGAAEQGQLRATCLYQRGEGQTGMWPVPGHMRRLGLASLTPSSCSEGLAYTQVLWPGRGAACNGSAAGRSGSGVCSGPQAAASTTMPASKTTQTVSTHPVSRAVGLPVPWGNVGYTSAPPGSGPSSRQQPYSATSVARVDRVQAAWVSRCECGPGGWMRAEPGQWSQAPSPLKA